jgi:hypothetical protein
MVIEAFEPAQLDYTSGGPKELSMLYTKEMLQSDLKEMQLQLLEYQQVELHEGAFHKGTARVIRCIAQRPMH